MSEEKTDMNKVKEIFSSRSENHRGNCKSGESSNRKMAENLWRETMKIINDIDEWFFDKNDTRIGKFPNIAYRILALLWFIPRNFMGKWHYRIFVRGRCAIHGCEEHYCCGGNLPDDVCEWYCKRCDAEGINHVVYTHEFFYSDTPLRNFLEALRGR